MNNNNIVKIVTWSFCLSGLIGLIHRHQFERSFSKAESLQNADRLAQAMLKLYNAVPPSEVRRILIVSYFRSGSTFLGDILQTPHKTFYHFEPFHITRRTRLRFSKLMLGSMSLCRLCCWTKKKTTDAARLRNFGCRTRWRKGRRRRCGRRWSMPVGGWTRALILFVVRRRY